MGKPQTEHRPTGLQSHCPEALSLTEHSLSTCLQLTVRETHSRSKLEQPHPRGRTRHVVACWAHRVGGPRKLIRTSLMRGRALWAEEATAKTARGSDIRGRSSVNGGRGLGLARGLARGHTWGARCKGRGLGFPVGGVGGGGAVHSGREKREERAYAHYECIRALEVHVEES